MDIIEIIENPVTQILLMVLLQGLWTWLVIVTVVRKGYEWWIGLLLGLFGGLIGAVVAAVLPNRYN